MPGTNERKTGRRAALGALLIPALVATGCMNPPDSGQDAGQEVPPLAERPNVLVIMTDDQPAAVTMKVMPKTRRWFQKSGTKFTNTFATTPLCCPSRASIFTGQYAHNHKVHASYREMTERLDHRSTMQRYLSEAGYRNAIFGKYLNEWDLDKNPPFFDDWAVMPGGKARGYYDGVWNVNGTKETIEQYSTNYIKQRGLAFLDDAEQEDERPWLMFLNLYAPHQPSLVPERFSNVEVPKWVMNPARSERDISDKPPFARRRDNSGPEAKRIYKEQLRTLIPADNAIDKVMTRLIEHGEGKETLAFFVSDNGYMLGEHQLLRKSEPYTPAAHIPMMARWPGRFEKGLRDGRVAGNIDIPPTVYEATGVTPDPEYPVDGLSLLGDTKRRNVLLEYWDENPDYGRYVPWSALRSRRFLYVEYYESDLQTVKFREYYDLRDDPWQLRNLFGDETRANDPDVSRIRERLQKLRQCSGDTCR